MKFDFSYDWKEGSQDIRHESHRATLADFSIRVDDRFFTSNVPLSSEDEDSSTKSSIFVSLFPLAEFMAANWWPLLHEPQEKQGLLNSAIAFDRRHWINKHTDGFAYPTLGLFGAGSAVRIVARPSHIESANIQFPETSGSAMAGWGGLDREEVEAKLLSFLTATAERLPSNDDKAWLKDVIARIQNSRADADEAKYCRCAGLLGSDPYDLGDDLNDAITGTIAILGEEIALEMFATTEVADVVDKASWVQERTGSLIQKSRELGAYVEHFKGELGAPPSMEEKPWERGYEAARRLRSLLGLAPDRPLAVMGDVTKALLDAEEFVICRIPDLEPNCGARGIARRNADGLGVAIGQNAGDPKFQLTATLGDFLLSNESEFFLSTKASTDRQKRNRAFAAEFLAPIQGIRERWVNGKSSRSNQEKIAEDFGVSLYIVQYQMQNQAPLLYPV
jgi:hypothetical protein